MTVRRACLFLFSCIFCTGALHAQVLAPGEGLTIWEYDAGSVVTSSPCVAYGKVFFGTASDRLVSLDVSNGQVAWEFNTGNATNSFLSSPMVIEQRVYAAAFHEKKVYALDALTGDLIWEYQASGQIEAGPRVSDGRVFIGSWDGQFLCLDAATGEKVWSYPVKSSIRGGAYLYGGRVVFGSSDRKMTCLDAATGKKIWDFDSGGAILSSPAGDGKFLYFGSQSGLFCLSLDNGRKAWEFRAGDQIASSPFLYQGKVYFGSFDDKFYCLQADNGKRIWDFKTGDNIFSSPSVVDGKAYFGSYDKTFYCLSAETGEKIWSLDTGNIIESSPCVVDGKVYFGGADGKLRCVEAGSIEFTAGNAVSGQDYKAVKEEEEKFLSGASSSDEGYDLSQLDLLDTNETVAIPEPLVKEPEKTVLPVPLTEPVLEAPPEFKEKIVYHYTVQIGAFVKRRNADAMVRRLERMGYDVYTRKFTLRKKNFTRVRVGRFVSFEEAFAQKDRLRARGIRGIVVRY